MDIQAIAALATIVSLVWGVVWGATKLYRHFTAHATEDEMRWLEIQKSCRAFRSYFRGANGLYLVGFRIPNSTTRPFTLRKAILTTDSSQNHLLSPFKTVQLDGLDTPLARGSWEIPANLACLFEIPAKRGDSLGIKSLHLQIAFSLSDGSLSVHELKIPSEEIAEEMRGFFEWGKTMKSTDGQMVTQSQTPGNVDMRLA